MLIKEYKWISIQENPEFSKPGAKTKVYDITNKESGFHLGRIGWYGPFRKYSVVFNDEAIFEQQCLDDIVSFLKEVEADRKSKIGK